MTRIKITSSTVKSCFYASYSSKETDLTHQTRCLRLSHRRWRRAGWRWGSSGDCVRESAAMCCDGCAPWSSDFPSLQYNDYKFCTYFSLTETDIKYPWENKLFIVARRDGACKDLLLIHWAYTQICGVCKVPCVKKENMIFPRYPVEQDIRDAENRISDQQQHLWHILVIVILVNVIL